MKKGILEIRKVVHGEIEQFIKMVEGKIIAAGFTPFEVGFTAIKGEEVFNDYTCNWDMQLDYISSGNEAREPVSWINDSMYPDCPHIRTGDDALQAACGLGPYVGFQVDALKYLHEAFEDEIWPELEGETQEKFSQMGYLMENCIRELDRLAGEIEQASKILYRNRQRIALGLDGHKVAA